MLFRRFYDAKLAQASYLIGCQQTGEAVVVDPNRDIEQYLDAAAAEGVRITHVTETHIHADFISGARELAQRAGAQLLLSDDGDANWKYAYAGEARARLLKDGDVVGVGSIRLDILHTPGHTPEHLSFLVTDPPTSDRPWGILTGDFVFVGDVGRPDLLEKAAKMPGTMEAAARALFHSLQRFRELPDYVQVWPGHGAGSACGKALGALPSSTVGYEKIANWGVGTTDEELFVRLVLEGQPEPPKYFAEMKRINKEGPRSLGRFTRPARLSLDRLEPLIGKGALVVDTRHMADYAAGHVPTTINIPLNNSFTTWAGWLVPYDTDFYLIINDQCTHCVYEAVRDLAMIGLDRVAGYFGSETIGAWAATGRPLSSVPQVTSRDLAKQLRQGSVTVLDVRGRSEWEAGHVPGVTNIPVGYLADRLGDIPRDEPVVVHCQGGARSAIAASLLRARGYTNVANLSGGLAGWQAAGNPIERAEAVAL